jgi:hypothetical protein
VGVLASRKRSKGIWWLTGLSLSSAAPYVTPTEPGTMLSGKLMADVPKREEGKPYMPDAVQDQRE